MYTLRFLAHVNPLAVSSEVPEMFFNPEFDLSRRSTFYKVYEDESDDHGNPKLEHLQYCLSMVERELSNRLFKRSDAFLRAFEDLNDLKSTIQTANKLSQGIKEDLGFVQKNLVDDGLRIVKLKLKRSNYEKLRETLEAIQQTRDNIETIEEMIQYGDVIMARQLLSNVQMSIDANLFGLGCMKPLFHKSKQMEKTIQQTLIDKFQEFSLSDALLHSDSLKSSSRTETAKTNSPDLLTDQIYLYVKELIETELISKALEEYSISEDSKIKICIRNTINDEMPNDPNELYSEADIQNMGIDVFLERINNLFDYVLRELRRTVYIKDIIEKVSLSDEKETNCISETNDMLNFISESTFIRIGKIYKLRAEQHRRLSTQKFTELFNMTQSFIKNCEKLTHREGGSSLRSALISQRRAFVDFIHEHNISKLSSILDNESWNRAEIAGEFSQILTSLMNPDDPLSYPEVSKQDNQREIYINDRKYLLVNTNLLFASILRDYLIVLECMPSLYSEIISRITELLRTYNKKSYYLVLGRGSVKLNVVKSISAIHLSLLFQQLSLIIDTIPKVKQRIEKYFKHPKEKALFHDMDEVQKDYTRHRREISEKYVSMMVERLFQLFKDYEVETSSTPCKPFVELFDKTKVLHKILNTVLNSDDMKKILKEIMEAYSENLTQLLQGSNPSDKRKIKTNVQYFSENLQTLNGMDGLKLDVDIF